MPALVPGIIDVPLGVLNQTPSDTQGVLGRLQSLINAQVHHYEGQQVNGSGQTIPSKLKVEPRDPFVSLASTARNVADGTAATIGWSNPELLNALGDQLVSICDSAPRVWNGSTWSAYKSATVLPHPLSETVFHTSQQVIEAPDSAYLNGVTCFVWTQTNGSTAPLTTSYVGFRASDDAWLATPNVLYASTSASVVTFAKVVTDGAHFFVVWNDGSNTAHVGVYDTHGALLGQTSGGTLIGLHGKVWDITPAVTASPAGTVLFAQCISTVTDNGVAFSSIGWSGSAVTVSSSLDNTVKGIGPLAFLTNTLGNGLTYLATQDTDGVIWAYEVASLAKVHQFGPFLDIATDTWSLDTITGYAVTGSDGVDVVLSIGQLPNVTDPISDGDGPPVDPSFRFLTTQSCDRSNVVATVRKTQSLCQVSRAFEIDGFYYVYAYYQSGSGLAITPRSANVTITTGDYMIGAATQPIAVVAGDETAGSPISTTNDTSGAARSVFVTSGSSGTIAAGWTVSLVNSSGLGNGIPDGVQVMRWVPSFTVNNIAGSRLTLTGVTGLNTTFDIIAMPNSSTFYTPRYDIFGNSVSPATITIGGTFAFQSMTCYFIEDQSSTITSNTIAQFFTSGSGNLVVTGSSHGNNCTSSIKRIRTDAPSASTAYPGMNPSYLVTPPTSQVWVNTGSQTFSSTDAYTAVLTSSSPNEWFFTNGTFDSTYIGADLVVTNDIQVPTNVGTYPITAAPFARALTTGGATALLPQIFTYPFPNIEIDLTTQIPYTFFLQSLTLDYTYQGALVAVQGADPTNNGVYKIIQINADGTFIAQPQDGLVNQVNQAFTNAQTITIFFNNDIAPEFQPCWFLVPLTGSQPVVGRFEYGTAYADWRIEADTTLGPNQYPFSVSSPVTTLAGNQIVLPYRAQSVTTAVPLATQAGQIQAAQEISASTVGLKAFTLSNGVGQSYANSGELLIPGPMASTFTDSGFHEDNINLALEAPYLVSQSVATSGQLCLTAGGKYFYVVVAEYTDENGNRIFSIPSPALEVDMALSNNVTTIAGRLMFPLSSTGQPVANTYGPTTRQVTISIYRSAFINGQNTTDHYKITNDLDVNGLAPVSATNSSGFSFPNSFTWQYIDQNPDIAITASEILYTDKAFLPRFPAPAFSTGLASWKNREWVIGYDGAVWMSGEKTEGDAIWYFPGFRYVFPAEDRPVGLGALEDFLVVFCQRSVWYIPAGTFPDATGANGALPTPLPIPGCQNGSSNGFALTLRDGVAYDSTAGGIWLITRNLQNIWLSQPVQDSLTGAVTGLAFDKNQRLSVLQAGSRTICVYDEVVKAWSLSNAPTQGALLTTYRGQAAYQDSTTVNVVTPGQTADLVAGVTYGIAPDITLAPLSFANVRGLKRVWEFQLVGDYLGPHNLNVVLSYPEDDAAATTYKPFVPSADALYIYPFNPSREEASQYTIRIYADFAGISVPGLSFALEMISAQVGLDPVGLNKRPSNVRLIANP